MTKAEILDKLKEIMLAMDPTRADLISGANENTRLVEDLGLTSVGILYMVVAIEETFSVNFDNLGVRDFKTIGDAVSFIEDKKNR